MAGMEICPVVSCAKWLYGVRFDEGTIYVCQGCLGVWLDPSILPQLLGIPLPINFDKDTLKALSSPDYEIRLVNCPLQHGLLQAAKIRDQATVDWCPVCGWIWLDRGMIDAVISIDLRKGKSIQQSIEFAFHGQREKEVLVNQERFRSPDSGFAQWITGVPSEAYNPGQRFPYMTLSIVGANVLLFLFELMSIPQYENAKSFFESWGLTPEKILHGEMLWTLMTYMLFHAGWMHLLGNLYFFWLAGNSVEDRLDRQRFLWVYVICGVFAGLFHAALHPSSVIPVIGASGAISGIIGAYTRFFPKRKLVVRVFYFLWFNFSVRVPAYVYFGFWFLLQAFFAMIGSSGIAFSAHIGGFIAGFAIAHRYAMKPQ